MAISVADYILRCLKEQNVDTIFGVPAFYCYPFFEAAIHAETRREGNIAVSTIARCCSGKSSKQSLFWVTCTTDMVESSFW
jgi:hypothetical protein